MKSPFAIAVPVKLERAPSPPATVMLRKLSTIAVMGATLLFAAGAAAVETVLAPPPSPARAGEAIAITVYFTNTAAEPVELPPPETLAGNWLQRGRRYPVTLELKDGSAAVLAAGEHLELRYTAPVPPSLRSGPLKLELSDRAAAPLVLMVRARAKAKRPAPAREEETPLMRLSEFDEDEARTRNSFLDNISAYQPLYFLAGPDPANAKFQISLKYRVLDDDSELGRNNPWLQGFLLGYTQTSFWDLSRGSFPFEDTNFKPEVFYQFPDAIWPALGGDFHTDMRAGFQHESNGRAGAASRSLNRAYLEPAVHVPVAPATRLSLRPRVWTYVGGLSGNPDIRRFRGRSSFTATLSRRDGWQVGAYLRGNPSVGRGATRLDVTYPLNRITNDNLDFYLHAQVFSGYGENLLNFDSKDTQLRMGLSIVR